MHTRIQKILPAAGLAALSCIGVSAQSADAIIDKLVDKGILTVDEANELKEEADKGFTTGYQVKSGIPDWVTTLRIGGDFRARYDMIHADDPTFIDRHRFRYRIRPGIFATIKDNFDVGFRLTSGEQQGSFGGDPISGNVTEQDNGSKKFVFIDLVYGKWAAINNSQWSASFTVGKMENPFVYSDMIFDGDYTPEGFAQQFSFNASDAHQIKFNLGQFFIDELSTDSEDPHMFGAQVRLESTWNKQVATSFGFGGLVLTSEEYLTETAAGASTRVQVVNAAGAPVTDAAGNPVTVAIPGTGASSAVPNVNRGNTRSNGTLVNDYHPWVADAAITYTLESFPRYNAPFPIRLAADYMNNPGADEHNEAYSIGITFGKAGKKGLWDIGYRWKHLEADAWYEEVVDSDFGGLYPPPAGGRATYGAGTNVEGHMVRANYSLFDSLTLGVTYFLAEAIAGLPEGYDESVGRLQVDAVWRF